MMKGRSPKPDDSSFILPRSSLIGGAPMKIEILADADTVARKAAAIIAAEARDAVVARGRFVVAVTDADVAVTGVYQGRRRMTLTYPIINRGRRILWLVTGKDKAGPLVRLRDADPSIPAGRVYQDQALVLADQAAAASLENSKN